MKIKILALFISLISILYSQDLVPIANLKNNNSNGIPIDLDKVFKVTGVVTSSNQLGTAGPATIQDNSGAMAVYGSSFANEVKIGDSVTVISTLTQYNGLAELNFTKAGSSYLKHKSNVHFDTLIVTLSQIKNQQWNGYEEFESQIVRVNNATISGTGNFEGNKTYTISDATGSLVIYSDKDVTTLVGTPIPSGSVDLIGVVGQYLVNQPYNSGYQIIPRFRQDIIDDGRPIIMNSVVAAKIDSTSFSVYFSTARNGNSKVKYGLTTLLELDSVVVNEDTTQHSVAIINLKPLTKYYFKVYSTNAAGTSESSLQSASTSSSNPQTGTINVYFNFDVDTTVAIVGNKANGNINFAAKLLNRINSATSSIDMAVYSFFGLNDIATAIINAKNRGVKVRIVYDNRTTQSSMQLLLNAGIKMSQRPAIDGLMHNKFFIFDERDDNPNNDWVWTGSWNVTSNELAWKNSALEINDPTLASAYTTEFEEMWGSNGDVPNAATAKFGPFKSDNTIHSFNIGGREVYLYFSPSDQTESRIVNAMQTADTSIFFAQMTFTSNSIFYAIRDANQSKAKDVRGIIDNINDSGSEYTNLKTFAEVFDYNQSATLHHKYGIVDASLTKSDPIVITGSHNWSASANEKNDENTLIIHDALIANQYLQEFKKRYNELGGTTRFVVPVITDVDAGKAGNIPDDFILFQNFPNPFNPVTTISFYLPSSGEIDLSVFNMLGEKVATVYSGYSQKGKNVMDFNASNPSDSKASLSSGIYFFKLTYQNKFQAKKFVVLK
ncbi:MAG: phospholipase D-like domain-containing protein [Ignavibacteriales bacterium]|nr:phospholipase D-like domain-containing protein [Ignavibacteriales bacterium]